MPLLKSLTGWRNQTFDWGSVDKSFHMAGSHYAGEHAHLTDMAGINTVGTSEATGAAGNHSPSWCNPGGHQERPHCPKRTVAFRNHVQGASMLLPWWMERAHSMTAKTVCGRCDRCSCWRWSPVVSNHCLWHNDPIGWLSVHAPPIQHVPTDQSGRPVPPWGTATNVASSWFCTGVESLEPWPNLSTLQYRLVDWEMMAQLPRGSASGFWQVWSMQGLFHTAQTHCRCVYICRLSLAPSKKEPCFSVAICIYVYIYICIYTPIKMYLFCSMALLLYPPSPAPRLARGIGHRLKRLTNHLTDLDRERFPTALPNGTGRLVLLLY